MDDNENLIKMIKNQAIINNIKNYETVQKFKQKNGDRRPFKKRGESEKPDE